MGDFRFWEIFAFGILDFGRFWLLGDFGFREVLDFGKFWLLGDFGFWDFRFWEILTFGRFRIS